MNDTVGRRNPQTQKFQSTCPFPSQVWWRHLLIRLTWIFSISEAEQAYLFVCLLLFSLFLFLFRFCLLFLFCFVLFFFLCLIFVFVLFFDKSSELHWSWPPVNLSIGVIFWLTPTICQFQRPRCRENSIIVHTAKYAGFAGYLSRQLNVMWHRK